jgi:hypothetical protein
LQIEKSPVEQSKSVPVFVSVVAAEPVSEEVQVAAAQSAEQAQQLQNLSERLRVAISDAQVATQLLADRETAYRALSSEVEALRAHNAILLSSDTLLSQDRICRDNSVVGLVAHVALEHAVESATAPCSSQAALSSESTVPPHSDGRVQRFDDTAAASETCSAELNSITTDSRVELERLLSLSQRHVRERDADITALLATVDRTAEVHLVQTAALQASLNQMQSAHSDALATRNREHIEELMQVQQQHSAHALQLQTDCDRMLNELRTQHADEMKKVQAETATQIQHVLTQRNARAKQFRDFSVLQFLFQLVSPLPIISKFCAEYVSVGTCLVWF